MKKSHLIRLVQFAFIVVFTVSFISPFQQQTFPTVEASPAQIGIPSVSVTMPPTVLIGESFTFTVTFDNTSPTDTGYGPFIDLIFPLNGADGAAGTSVPDGIDFVDATFLGLTLTADQFIFPVEGCVNHPYARDTQNLPTQVCGVPGDKLVVIRLPFGSLTSSQPPVDITVTALLSPLADPGVPLSIQVRGGFQFGSNPLNDPCCDQVILLPDSSDSSLWPGAPTTPTLMQLTKTANAPEDGTENVSGPNFTGEYTITINVADGQTITDLDVTDEIPPTLAFVSVVSTTPAGGTVTTSPPVGIAQNPPDNQLVVNFLSVTGGPGTDDVIVVWQYVIPQNDADGNPVLSATTGAAVLTGNRANGIGDWIPPDARDSAIAGNAITPGGAAPDHAMWYRSMAVQKDLSEQADIPPTGYSPGDTLQYVLTFQVSDFYTYGDLILTDVLSDGQRLEPTSTPTFLITDRSGTFSGTFTAGSFNSTVSPTDGQTTLTFNVSAALVAAGDDGILQGGRAVAPDAVGATGTITYRAIIQEDFTNTFPSGDSSVDMNDLLNNQVDIDGTLRDNASITTVIGNQSDIGATEERIVKGTLDKTIYAVNGTVCAPCSDVAVDPDDAITYRIEYILPVSDIDNLIFVDYLPLPIFDATTLTTFNPVVSATPPVVGSAQFGPNDTFFVLSSIVPALTTSAAENIVNFDYGSFDDPADQSSRIDMLFTVAVLPVPFADRLTLNNFVEGQLRSTDLFVDPVISGATVQVRQPLLVVRKSVVGSSNPTVTISPPVPVTFNPPGTSGTPWSGTVISSSSLAANDINSDLSGALPGDLVRFVIIIENVGTATDGAFDIRVTDNLAPGFRIPDSGLNLTATRGNGTPVSYIGSPNDLFGSGIELIDPGATEGVCQQFDATSGANIVVVAYDLQIDTTGPASGVLENRGTVSQYSSADNVGTVFNHVGDTQLTSDTAIITASGFSRTTTMEQTTASSAQQDVTTLPSTGYPPSAASKPDHTSLYSTGLLAALGLVLGLLLWQRKHRA